MTPDDPRHGAYSGHLQHVRDSEESCDPCKYAAYRRNKAMKARLDRGIRHRVPIGEEGWRLLNTVPRRSLAIASGLNPASLAKIIQRGHGPDTIVHIDTRHALLAARGKALTPIGLARRLQAITAMGWSMRIVADGTPFSMDAYKRIRRMENRMFVQYELALEIVAAYNRLSMTPAPTGRSAAKTRRWAADQGYLTSLAWEYIDIDDPNAKPEGTDFSRAGHVIDEAAIERRVAGDTTVRLHKGETAEVARRLLAAGVTTTQILRDHGIKAERYVRVRQEVAA